MNSSKRLKKAREQIGLTQSQFAEKIGLSWDKIKNIETERHKLTAELAEKIEQIYSIDGWWLLTGKGKMLNEQSNTTQYIQGSSNFAINGSGNKISRPSYQVEKNSDDLIEIPYFRDTYAAAGDGAINYDEAPRPMAFDKNFLRVTLGITALKHIHIINAIGNSMTPTIKEGELLFVNPFENEFGQIKDGGIYIISCNKGVLVKRIHHNPITGDIVLVSDNPNVADIPIRGDEFKSCNIIGRVVGHFSSL